MSGALTAKYAVLATEYGLHLDEILGLSPRQREEVYFHPRKEDGTIKAPATAAPGSKLQQLLALVESGLVKATPEQVAALRAKLDGSPGDTRETAE